MPVKRPLRAGLVPALLVAGLGACARTQPAPPATARLQPDEEPALADLRQLTFGGENAEAYWSFDGTQLSFQAHTDGEGCDRIYRMQVLPEPKAPVRVSSGQGTTTCAHFFPSGDLLYSSTHLAGKTCPPAPDRSKGYVWALYDSYDIFTAAPDGSRLRRLTESKGYDAEATVCSKDGSIVFTSTRDGDIELYRMDADGKNLKRLTHSVGYDGGAFFNRDCSKIVWRASRPRPGKETDDYKALLAQGLVRPSKLELWVAAADGSEPMQLTYLDAASFAPFFHPTEDAILFSSNYGDPHGREFDIWAIRGDGSGLQRITHSPGFDGFPHVSPDGKYLAFSSNRATAPGRHDTNVFLARWKGLRPLPPEAETGADRISRDLAWLAQPERQGRGIGTEGLAAAGGYLEARLKDLGLEPAGDEGTFRQKFPVVTAAEIRPSSQVTLGGRTLAREEFGLLGFSSEGKAKGALVLAGYGIVAPEQGIDDYAGLDVKGKVVLVRRFSPEGDKLAEPALRRRLGDLRQKAWVARERGATALLVVDWPLPPTPAPADWKPPAEAPLLPPSPSGAGDAGIPVVMVKRAAVEALMPQLAARKAVTASIDVGLVFKHTDAFNVIGRISAGKSRAPGAIVIGAHYDHLGFGGRYSLAPGRNEPHVGADDNASGTATVLEIARDLAGRRAELSHDVLIAFFSGEESGLLGSAYYTRTRAEEVKEVVAMLNLDMVGRLRGNKLELLGSESASEWTSLAGAACADLRLQCTPAGDGGGPSDQASFYAAGVPVLHFFTGSHADYHKPSDTAGKINAAGAATIAHLAERLVTALDVGPRLTFQKGKSAPPGGDSRSFNASLGTIPDYAGPPDGRPGVLLSGVRSGGAADKAGLRRGDILVGLGAHEIRSVEDLMYALNASRPGETVTASLIREGKTVKVEVTFQEARRAP
jgi:Tol biopolymer transport system component